MNSPVAAHCSTVSPSLYLKLDYCYFVDFAAGLRDQSSLIAFASHVYFVSGRSTVQSGWLCSYLLHRPRQSLYVPPHDA
jgi:hypothetical protein